MPVSAAAPSKESPLLTGQQCSRQSSSVAEAGVTKDEIATVEYLPIVDRPADEPTSTSDANSAVPGTTLAVAEEHLPSEVPQDEDYSVSSGFWSLRDYEQDSPNTPAEHVTQHVDTNQQVQQHNGSVLFRQLWAAEPRPGKIDLSYWNPRRGEAAGTYPRTTTPRDELAFRASGRRSKQRRATRFFMQHVYHHVSSQNDITDQIANTLLRYPAVNGEDEVPFEWDEVLNWSWVLFAESSLSVQRLALLIRQPPSGNQPPVPLWVVMQLLRSASLDPESLSALLVLVESQASSWNWLADEPMLLTVRLLRYARQSALPPFEAIVDMFIKLLHDRPLASSESELRSICHYCNRLLSLLAIPTSVDPFRSMHAQQAAQLALVRHMQEAEPQIPLMREGYRAIAKVQLMHLKTEQEKEWARAKALTWPPWEKQNQMGSVVKPTEYRGMRSRVIKVLERMQETGYAPYDYDLAVRILTGWDTDNSPTWQMRRTAASISIPKPWLRTVSYVAQEHSPLVWSARVEATRTVREAWMCFCAYSAATPQLSQSPRVYHAMFKKLFAREMSASDDGPLPGDGKEVYPDPDLARDRVYIPEEIPSVSALFSRMVAQEIQPYTRLLADLIRQESSLQQGLHYLSFLSVDEEKKTALSSPERHRASEVAAALETVPSYLVRSYVGFLARPIPKHEPRLRFEGQSGPIFVKSVLEAMNMRVQQVSIWNAYFHSLNLHTLSHSRNCHKESLHAVWALACDIVSNIANRKPINFITFTQVASIAFRMGSSVRVGIPETTRDDPITVAKKLFQRAVSTSGDYSRVDLPDQWRRFCTNRRHTKVLHSVPSGDAIEAMVWVLACGTDAQQDIRALLKWVRKHHERITASGHRFSAHNIAAFRVFLEGMWADEEILETWKEQLTIKQRLEAQRMLKELGTWPEETYMKNYLLGLSFKITRVRNKYKSRIAVVS
ncbi:hypothetical protein OHC33_001009 [Knufia fluminis]|uniref:Uncharacterized protein n=1 Tax=Knufia fluminis TaxID=191047 RepID=A0AAN8ENU3_9EURO|nr:hypothetical protein OHC33_001009 [Knufia fluminis]